MRTRKSEGEYHIAFGSGTATFLNRGEEDKNVVGYLEVAVGRFS